MTDEQVALLGAAVAGRLGVAVDVLPTPRIEDVRLPAPRIDPPAVLAPLTRRDVHERSLHSHGRSYRDVVRGVRGQFDHPVDLVVHPESEADVVAVLDWCSSSGIACLPFGGGSSVVGGVEPVGLHDLFRGVVSLDLTGLDRVLEIDRTSRAARIQSGVWDRCWRISCGPMA